MYALRERRVHVTQEDFEMAVAKVDAPDFLHLLMMALEQWAGACAHYRILSLRSCKRIVRRTCPSRNYGSEPCVLGVDPSNKAL